jgi:GH43 family beta-xylosidase
MKITGQYYNPLVMQRADPWVYLHIDNYYYFTASVPEYDRIELRRAKALNEMSSAEPVTVWEKHTSGEMSCLIWAPELHYVDGRWIIYFSASSKPEVFGHRIFALEFCRNYSDYSL